MSVTSLRLINSALFISALGIAASPYAPFCCFPAAAIGYVTRMIDERRGI